MLEIVQYQHAEPLYTAGATTSFNARAFRYLPTWVPDPCPIIGFQLWLQHADFKFPTGAVGAISVIMDPGGNYAEAAKYPVELTSPIQIKTLATLPANAGAANHIRIFYPHPMMYRASAGDKLLFVPENLGGYQCQLYWTAIMLNEGDLIAPHDYKTVLSLDVDGPDGSKVIRDSSVSNHHPILYGGVAHSMDEFCDGSSLLFNGTDGYLRIQDRPWDFVLDGGSWRTIFCGGTDPAVRPYIAINPSGQLACGKMGSNPHLVGTGSYADGQWHSFEYRRAGSQATLKVDGEIEATTTDTNNYAPSASGVLIGCTGAAGFYRGNLRDFQVFKNAR